MDTPKPPPTQREVAQLAGQLATDAQVLAAATTFRFSGEDRVVLPRRAADAISDRMAHAANRLLQLVGTGPVAVASDQPEQPAEAGTRNPTATRS